jgi:hypothetical protein
MRVSVAGLVLIAVLLSPAHADAKDLLGWQSTRWGMTEQQALVALDNQATKVTPPEKYQGLYSPLKTTLEISGYKMDVVLQFSNQTKTLRQVLLTYKADSIDLWSKLRDLLAEKYGNPRQMGKALEWRFTTTIVELDRLSIPGIIGQVSVRYYPASEYRDDKKKL